MLEKLLEKYPPEQRDYFMMLLAQHEVQNTGERACVDLHDYAYRFFTSMGTQERTEFVVAIETLTISSQLRKLAKEMKVVALEMNGGLGSSLGMDPNLRQSKASGIKFTANENELSVLQAKFMWMAQHAKNFAGLGIIPWNSNATKDSWDQALQGKCLLDPSKTYAEFLKSKGVAVFAHEIQHAFPRFCADTLTPFTDGRAKDRVAPGGHGQILYQLYFSGKLHELRNAGYQILTLLNADGLSAKPSRYIAAKMLQEGIMAGMVTTDRTPIDAKGGILVVRRGELNLIEIAQVAKSQRKLFQQYGLRKGDASQPFNTNTIYLNLHLLIKYLDEIQASDGVAGVKRLLTPELIVNHKKVATKAGEFAVEQLEGAIGSVVLKFPGVKLFNVSAEERTREFTPVKRPGDVVYLYDSDAFEFDVHSSRLKRMFRGAPARLELSDWVGWTDLAKTRECFGKPSLALLHSLQVKGEVSFRDAVFQGEVIIENNSGEPVDLYQVEGLPREGSRLILSDIHLSF